MWSTTVGAKINMPLKKILLIAIWGAASIFAYRYAYLYTKALNAEFCSEEKSRLAKFNVEHSARGNISYLLDGRAISCRYAAPFSCPNSRELEEQNTKYLNVTEVVCNGAIGQITVVKQLQTMDKKSNLYSSEYLLDWSKKANRYSDLLILPLAMLLVSAFSFLGFYNIFLKDKK
jgi:hypothetical protein